MHFYRDDFGNWHPLPEQVQTPDWFSTPPSSNIDWGEILVKSVLTGAGMYLAAKGIEALFSAPPRSRKMSRRDTFRYRLRDRRTCVQFGITNNPPIRCSQHVADGKEFSVMEIIGPVVTRASAREWEYNRIETYRRHFGQRPKYNRVS